MKRPSKYPYVDPLQSNLYSAILTAADKLRSDRTLESVAARVRIREERQASLARKALQERILEMELKK